MTKPRPDVCFRVPLQGAEHTPMYLRAEYSEAPTTYETGPNVVEEIVLTDGRGAEVARLRLVTGGGETKFEREALAARVADAINLVDGGRKVRHLKRGKEYAVLGVARGQVSVGSAIAARGPKTRTLGDGDELAFYYHPETGELWWRPEDEFEGRFEEVEER